MADPSETRISGVAATSLPGTPSSRDWLLALALVVAVLALALAGGVFWYLQARMQDMEVQLARRIGEFDTSSREARSAAREVRTSVDTLMTRVAGIEAKALETQSEQLALAAMYQELARTHDERLLADMEQTLLLADQQLRLAGNIRAAILGLEAADARLTKMEKPQFRPLREAMARDLAELKLFPNVDVMAINERLDALVHSVDRLKLESDSETPLRTAAPPTTGAVDWIERLSRETWEEIKQLVRIRHLDHPDLALLAPRQSYFLRQNLKLRLLSARLASLQHDETTYRSDLRAARQWVQEYFNPRDVQTKTVLDDLKALEAMPVALGTANISASLDALQKLRGERR